MIRQRLALIGHNDLFSFYCCIFGVLIGIYEEFQTDACQAYIMAIYIVTPMI